MTKWHIGYSFISHYFDCTLCFNDALHTIIHYYFEPDWYLSLFVTC